ncbi:3'-phosphoadenylsulfate reductase [Collariella sp. IMI 366227]|nr:3'-phosphoadenylsulfate reductase [Collariella sp. IMI 366227]
MADDSRTETSSQLSSPGDHGSVDSGFVSPSSSTVDLPRVSLTQAHLRHLNKQLESLEPMDILRFCRIFFPNLYQSTAFGLTGLVTVDMLSKLDAEASKPQPIDLIFLDTLYHFKETHDLVDRVKSRYNVRVHVFKPADVESVDQFEDLYGEKLYETSSELYDWIAKVEPLQRAYSELKVAAVLTGRRRSQGGQRGDLGVIELDDERGVIKINPLANWTFAQVKAGYKSIGDWHSTVPVGEGEDERAGRWKGQTKTECGIHNKQSRYAMWLQQQQAQQQAQVA